MGIVNHILIADGAGEKLRSMAAANFHPRKGIEGDRYFLKTGTFSEKLAEKGDFEVTLIESEKIDAFNRETNLGYPAEMFRRNIVTSDIDLNALVGKEFRLGTVLLRGVRLCEPCAYLSKRLGDAVMEKMRHKCGLRAVIVEGGTAKPGDPIE